METINHTLATSDVVASNQMLRRRQFGFSRGSAARLISPPRGRPEIETLENGAAIPAANAARLPFRVNHIRNEMKRVGARVTLLHGCSYGGFSL